MSQVMKRLLLIGASFIVGLVVFYMPEQPYRSLDEVWLPPGEATEKADTLSLPVRSWFIADGLVRFGAERSSGPQIVEGNNRTAPACGRMFYEEGLRAQTCGQMGKMRVAVSGMASDTQATAYLETFTKVARRDVNSVLGKNRIHVKDVLIALQDQTDSQSLLAAQAYTHLPFVPLMPATLPANWSQQSIRISGKDALHPSRVDIFYNKGRERNVTVSIVSSKGFRLDTACGPTPNANGQFIACSKVANEDYFVGGQNDGSVAYWYAYRLVGDAVAVVQVSAFAQNGFPPVLLNRDLDVQAAITKSLHAVSSERFKDATFSARTD